MSCASFSRSSFFWPHSSSPHLNAFMFPVFPSSCVPQLPNSAFIFVSHMHLLHLHTTAAGMQSNCFVPAVACQQSHHSLQTAVHVFWWDQIMFAVLCCTGKASNFCVSQHSTPTALAYGSCVCLMNNHTKKRVCSWRLVLHSIADDDISGQT